MVKLSNIGFQGVPGLAPRGTLQQSTRQPTAILIPTWRTGYASGIKDAEEAKASGDTPFLLKLVSQDSPNPLEQSYISAQGFEVLSVSNRFRDGWEANDLSNAFITAWKQSQEGFGSWSSNIPLQVVATTQVTTSMGMSDDNKREFLQAIYGNAGDDGVR